MLRETGHLRFSQTYAVNDAHDINEWRIDV